jgi:Phage tail lysozyme
VPELNDCAPNAAIAFYYLKGRGFSSAQAAGIIGNLQVESPGLNPLNDTPDPRKDDPSARGRGIAAWGPTRWQNLRSFAAGRDPWELETQLAFLVHELETDSSLGLQDLLNTTSVPEATVAFQNRFERCDPARCHPDVRIRRAYDALSCLSVSPPTGKGRVSVVAASIGLIALVAAAGYSAHQTLRAL